MLHLHQLVCWLSCFFLWWDPVLFSHCTAQNGCRFPLVFIHLKHFGCIPRFEVCRYMNKTHCSGKSAAMVLGGNSPAGDRGRSDGDRLRSDCWVKSPVTMRHHPAHTDHVPWGSFLISTPVLPRHSSALVVINHLVTNWLTLKIFPFLPGQE